MPWRPSLRGGPRFTGQRQRRPREHGGRRLTDTILKPWRRIHADQHAIDRRVIKQCLWSDAAGKAGRHGQAAHPGIELVVVVMDHTAIRRGTTCGARRSLPGEWSRWRFEQVLPQPHACPADTGEHGAQWYALQVGSLLVGEAAHDHQQQRLTEFLGKPAESPLHGG